MPRISTAFLDALDTPVVTWQKPVPQVSKNDAAALEAIVAEIAQSGQALGSSVLVAAASEMQGFIKAAIKLLETYPPAPAFETVNVFNPAINMAKYTVEFDNHGTKSQRAYITTPRLRLEPIGAEDDEAINSETKDFLTGLYQDDATMRDYADVITWDQARREAAGEKRYNMFAGRWNEARHCSSGFVVYDHADKRVAVVNIGTASDASDKVIPNTGEFALIVNAADGHRKIGSELGPVLHAYAAAMRANQCTLPDGVSPMDHVTATAKQWHGSDKIMTKLALPKISENEKYGAQRNVYREAVDNLEAVLANTKLRNRAG